MLDIAIPLYEAILLAAGSGLAVYAALRYATVRRRRLLEELRRYSEKSLPDFGESTLAKPIFRGAETPQCVPPPHGLRHNRPA